VRMVRMAKVGVAGSSFAPGALTVAGLNRAGGGVSRTARFGLHHRSAADPTALPQQPNRRARSAAGEQAAQIRAERFRDSG